MSINAFKSFLCNTGRLLSHGRHRATNVKALHCMVNAQKLDLLHLPNRCFTRSLWYLCRKENVPKNIGQVHSVLGHPKMCGCCGLHTQGDQELAEFLADEIKLETENQKSQGKLPRINGFELMKADGADIVLTKKADNETVTIRFNVNHSIDDDSAEFEESGEQNAEMLSKPAFTVEINKGGKMTLAIQCQFPSIDMADQSTADQEAQYEEVLEITEVAMLDNNEGNWEEKAYSVSGHIMDGNLYDMLLNMLEERGITADCVDQIVDFATAYEQQTYIKFLSNLKDFSQGKDC